MQITQKNPPTTVADPWVICPNPNPRASLRLFCFPFAGGGAATFHPWARLLPPEVELYSIRLPGRESRMREAPFVRLLPLVEALAGALSPYFIEPFAFFGHSMGALLSFELTRHLRRQSAPQPVQLFAASHRAPQLPDPYPPLYHLPDDEFIAEMHQRYDGVPQAILSSDELRQLFMPVMRADATLLDTYTYIEEAPLALPITAFGGQQDRGVNARELDAWRNQTQSSFSLTMFAGNHFFLQGEQEALVQAIVKDLAPYVGAT